LGLEPTLDLFVANLVEVFHEVWRVLRNDGTLWLNLGDSFSVASTHAGNNKAGSHGHGEESAKALRGRNTHVLNDGLKPKDLCLIPFRVALALQGDGWYLRAVCPWIKASAMPESVRDRPGISHEYLFLLAKAERYFYDSDAVRVGSLTGDKRRVYMSKGAWDMDGRPEEQRHGGELRNNPLAGLYRNRRTGDWWLESLDAIRESGGLLSDPDGEPLAFAVNPAPYPGAHFACFPERLITPCILASTPEAGVCAECGKPLVRVVETIEQGSFEYRNYAEQIHKRNQRGGGYIVDKSRTLGFRPACACGAAAQPATVLDPFAGSGTTLAAAVRHGRHAIGIELNPEYVPLIQARLREVPPALPGLTSLVGPESPALPAQGVLEF